MAKHEKQKKEKKEKPEKKVIPIQPAETLTTSSIATIEIFDISVDTKTPFLTYSGEEVKSVLSTTLLKKLIGKKLLFDKESKKVKKSNWSSLFFKKKFLEDSKPYVISSWIEIDGVVKLYCYLNHNTEEVSVAIKPTTTVSSTPLTTPTVEKTKKQQQPDPGDVLPDGTVDTSAMSYYLRKKLLKQQQ